MKKILSITFLSLFLSANLLLAQDMLPSDVYYKDNIAINDISTEAPSLKAPGTEIGPGGSGGPGGPETGSGGAEWVGGEGGVDSPIGDAILPLTFSALLYAGFVYLRRSKKAI